MPENKSMILVVDDDDAKRYSIVRILKAEGFDTAEAADGRTGLVQSQRIPDLIVLDIKLPDISGYDVCRQIKAEPRTSHIPVLQLSATFVEPAHRAKGLDSGADAYLSDSVTPLELTATVRALLRARRAEQQARESEQRYRTLAESLPQLIWTALPDGYCDYVSSQWVRFTGIPAEKHLGSNWTNMLHPADRDSAYAAWRKAVEGFGDYDVEYRLRRADGVYRWFKTRGSPLRNDNGQIVKWMGTCTDVHAEKEAAEERLQLLQRERAARSEAENANRLKDEFLATLSHELRTPLMAVLGWAELLKTGRLNEAETQQAISTIDRNAKSQAQLIEDLLDVSRIISGKLRLDVQPIDLIAVINAAADSVRTAADAKEIRLQFMLDPLGSLISGDPGRLQQVVWNLLSNAIKFTPRGGSVTIGLSRVSSHIEVSVKDTGQGIDPQFLPYVFDRFRQADASTRRAHSGLGLGLAIVRHLAELHGGAVSAFSEGEGTGATFTVQLPLTAVHQTGPATAVKESETSRAAFETLPSLASVRVLVVDDEADAREVVCRALQRCQANVRSAKSVDDALAEFEQWRPDVVISDIGMPSQDGYDLIRRLREVELRIGGRVPAVALTAFARVEDRQRALLAGYQMHVAKPVAPSELIAIVASLSGKISQ